MDEPTRPEPIGWQAEKTYTGRAWRYGGLPPGMDPRFDCRPSRNPYPRRMPSLEAPGPSTPPVNARALRSYEKLVHEYGIRVAGGERELLRDLRTQVQRKKALLEEMGTGVVFLSPAEEAFLARGDDEEALT